MKKKTLRIVENVVTVILIVACSMTLFVSGFSFIRNTFFYIGKHGIGKYAMEIMKHTGASSYGNVEFLGKNENKYFFMTTNVGYIQRFWMCEPTIKTDYNMSKITEITTDSNNQELVDLIHANYVI